MRLHHTIVNHLIAFGLLVFTSSAHAVLLEFELTFDGTSISLDPGSINPSGSTLLPGDAFSLDLRAGNDDVWRVNGAYSNVYFPLTFVVTPSDTRTADIVAALFLDGVLVDTIVESNVTQRYVHIGAQQWSLPTGLSFDRVSLSYSLLTASAPTEILSRADIFASFGSFGPFFNNSNISYTQNAIPEPGSLAIFALGLGLAGCGFSRRNARA